VPWLVRRERPRKDSHQWRLGSIYVGLTPNLRSPSIKASPGCIQPLLVFYKVYIIYAYALLH
jgi:hypothetical protein